MCHYCKKEGHFRRDCRKLAINRKNKQKANVAAESQDSFEMCLVAGNAEKAGVWYLDSGATSHMTNDMAILGALDKSKTATICLADGNVIKSTGASSGKLAGVNGEGSRVNVKLENVFHVPSLASNLGLRTWDFRCYLNSLVARCSKETRWLWLANGKVDCII